MGEVKNNLNREVKENVLLAILNHLKSNSNLKNIRKELSISKQELNYYLRCLIKSQLIERKGRGWYEVKISTKDTLLPKEVRGHAFIWKVKIPSIKNWDKRIEILNKNNIEYSLVGIKNTPRLIINNRKVWLGKESLIIYEKKSFLADNSINARKYAVSELISIVKSLERKLGISFKSNQVYLYTPRREHYSLMKNNLAIQVRKSGEKLYCYDKSGTWWFCCDESYNLDEAEFQTTKETNGLVQSHKGQSWFNEMKDTKWQVTPSFILDCFNKMQSQLVQAQEQSLKFEKQIKSHLALIKEYRKENVAWRKNEVFKIKKDYKEQRNLREWLK